MSCSHPNDSVYARPVTVEFNMNSERYLSPMLFGDNLEHTRDCINTGLSAQMLKNRKFVGKPDRFGCALAWERIGDHAGFRFIFEDTYTKHGEGYTMVRANESHSLIITGYGAGVSGVRQRGLVLKAGQKYVFSMVSRVFAPMDVRVALLDESGTILDEKTMAAESGEYTPYEVQLSAPKDTGDACLEITFSGENTLTLGVVSLMPEDNFLGMRRDVIDRMKQLGIRLLRWPGGNFSGEYHWKDGLLPRDQRAPIQSYLWIETQPHTWGYDYHEINTDEFLALCEEIGAEPFITINPTWNTPQDSADWVEYCNGDVSTPYGALRASRGRVEPYNVKCWSLGNEFGYGHMEGTNGPVEYAAAVRLHAEKMLAVTPDLRLCSSGPYPDQKWAEQSAKALADVAKVVSLHHYAEFPEYMDPALRKQDYYRFIAKPDTEYLPRIQALRAQLGENQTISLDEWNAWAAWFRAGSITEGIFAAHFLNMIYRNAEEYGVSQVCHFESVNEGSILVYPDRAELTPAGCAISAMRDHAEGRILALEEDVVVTEKQGIITCTLTNRSYDEEKTFFLPLGETVPEGYLLTGEGVVTNTRFRKEPLVVCREQDGLRIVLPEHSIAVVRYV